MRERVVDSRTAMEETMRGVKSKTFCEAARYAPAHASSFFPRVFVNNALNSLV